MSDTDHRMEGEDVVAVLDLLASAGVACWVDGGWAVDAVVGRQSRRHEDLDLVVPMSDIAGAIEVLQAQGFTVDEDLRPISFTMCAKDGRKVDIHPVTWDPNGGGVQAQPNNSTWIYPAEGFRGVGTIVGRRVNCLSAEVQVLCHDGYQLDQDDLQDLALLRSVLADAK